MEIKNNTLFSKETMKKYISFAMHKGKNYSARRIIAKVYGGIFLGVLLISMIVMLITGIATIVDMIPMIVLIALFISMYLFITRLPYINGKKLINANMNYIFNNDVFTVITSSKFANTNGTFQYDFLDKVYETDNYYYLYINKSSAHIVDKNGFENTTAGEFSKFLESKLPPKKFIRCQ